MTKTMRILTLLLLTMVGAGQMWAETDEPSNIKRGTITGGSIAFYADEACTSDFEGDVAANATVYVKATPEIGNTAIGVTFTVKKSIGSDAMQAPSRRSSEGPGVTSDITVTAVTGKPGIYSFVMPADGNTNVSVSATFAAPEQQQVSYVDGNGESQTVNAYVLDETMQGLSTGFYVVPDGGITFSHLTIADDANLILRDGATMTVDGTIEASDNHSLTIYAQTAMTGQLTVTTYACGVILVPHFVAYSGDYATAFIAAGTVSDANKTTINGKTLKPLAGNAFTKYVPQDKAGSFTFALPALPEGASYSFTKTDDNGVINTYSYDAQNNTLTYTTNSGKNSGTTGAINVAATGATNNDDYSFTLNVTVSEYTTAYGWPEQTNIYLIGNDWAFYIRDGVERVYHDNELVWSADGVTLNTAMITINGGTPSNVTYKVNGTVLTAGENNVVLAPGAYRINITGDNGKLDDWLDFKVIKLVEDDHFEFNVSNVINAAPEEAEAKGLRVSSGGKTGEWTGDVVLKYNGEDVKDSENTTIWYRGTGFYYDDEKINLYDNPTYRTPAVGMTSAQSTFTVGNGNNSEMRVYNVNNGSASLDGVSQISTVCGKLVWHGEGEEIKRKLDLDDMPISSGVDGGYVYYVGVDCPDFYLKEDGKVYYKDKTGEHLEAENKTYTDGKDIFYAGGETIFEYTDFICYGSYSFTLDDDDPAPLCENRKALGDIIGYCNCPKDEHGNCTSCFSQSQDGNTLTVCGETIEMGPYIVVGTNFILTGNRAIYNIVPSVEHKIAPTDFNTEINGSTISFLGHSINAGNRPIIKGNFWLGPQQIGGCGLFRPCAYARYETAPYCYAIARRDIDFEVRRSVVSVDCKSEYKVGEDVDMKISSCSYKYPDDTETYYGSTGNISVFLNNVYYQTLNGANSHDLCFSDLPAGTYKLKVVLDGDQGYQGSTTTTTFTVVRTDSKVTLTGKQNTVGEAFETDAEIEYDPENPIVVNAVNDKAVSGTFWKWQISNTSDAGVVEIDHTVNESKNNAKNSEDVYLKTIGLGTVKLWAGFSGNNLYNPAKEAITFTVVPKNVANPIIELVDQSTIYYDGTAKEPAVKVYYAEGKEIPADQYDVTYDNNTNVSSTNSKAKIIVKSKTGALYTIDAEKEFEIQETIVLFAANSTNLWATFCSQNEYEVPEGCTAYTISSISGSTVMLSDALTTVPAYTPVLIQRDANVTLPVTAIYKAAGSAPASGYDAQTGLAATPGTAFTFYGNCLRSDVSPYNFKGHYNEGQTYLLYDGKFIQADENGGLGAHKCLLVLNGTYTAPVLTIGTETTSLSPVPSPSREGSSQRWYTLDGRKLSGKPTQKGIYVNGGRKVVIK